MLAVTGTSSDNETRFYPYKDKDHPRFEPDNCDRISLEADAILIGDGKYIRSQEIVITRLGNGICIAKPIPIHHLEDN